MDIRGKPALMVNVQPDVSKMSRDECFVQLIRAALRQLCRMLLSKPRAFRTREESN